MACNVMKFSNISGGVRLAKNDFGSVLQKLWDSVRFQF